MTARRALGVWTLALLAAAGAVALVLNSDHVDSKVTTLALAVPIALAFVASGIIARSQRPANATGILLVVTGFAWCLSALTTANDKYLFTAGLLLGTVFAPLLGHLFLAFPTGRLSARTDRRIVAAFYAAALALPPLAFFFDEGELVETSCDGPCPDNVLSVVAAQPIATMIAIVYGLATLVLVVLVLVRMIQRWRRASPALRRSLAPVFASAAVLIALVVAQSILGFFAQELAEAMNWIVLAAVLTVPLSFLYGLLRPRFGAATRRLVAELSQKRRPAEVQAVLRRALRDPELELGYRVDGGDSYVDVHGAPLELPANTASRAATIVGDEVIVHDAALLDQPELNDVLDAVHIALERGLSLRSLETSERRAEALLDAIPDNVFRVRGDGTFLDARVKRNVEVFGGAEAFVGHTVNEVMPPDVAVKLMAALERVLENGEPALVEYELSFQGASKHIEARIVQAYDDEVVAITRDVTERKRREQELRTLANEQAALRRVATLAAEVGDRERNRLVSAVTEEAGKLLEAQTASTIRFGEDGSAAVVGSWSAPGAELIPPGTVVPLDSETPVVQVARTGTPARIESYEGVAGELAARMRATGRRSGVAAPIFVAGRLWGAIHAGRTTDEPFPPQAEQRIGQFGEIVGIALANAEAREALAGLVEEQAALSRVAVAVATAARPESVFAVVTEEVGRLFGAHASNLIRFDKVSENEAVVVGGWSEADAVITPVGTRIELLGGAVTEVRRTARPARASVPDVARSEPELLERLRELGIRSLVAVPIEVSGELWGAVVVWRTDDEEFRVDVEERLVQFGKLVAVAVANAEAHEQLAGLAEEQAALRRVAVAVATGERPERLFNVVTEEVARLLDAPGGMTVRYEPDAEEVVVVGTWHMERREFDLGARFPLRAGAVSQVKATGQPARVSYVSGQDGGERQMVAAPIIVSGRLWGATTVSIPRPRTFPPDAEERLGQFTNLVALALANAEAHEQLTASRTRIVQAADAARRRLERNLHDGAQQRLVTLSLTLRLALAKLHSEPSAAQELLETSSSELALALEELRELARGLHPAILSDRGLGAALEALATRAPVPVELSSVPVERLPPLVEAAAYYVVAESLTNVAKYAEASSAQVSVERHDGVAVVQVADDGVGGADVARGSGLRGLADRVEALNGRFSVTSEAGRGTRVRAEIPCAS